MPSENIIVFIVFGKKMSKADIYCFIGEAKT